MTDETALDNPVWSCLTTRHAHLAEGSSLALRYPVAFSPLAGVPLAAAENLRALQELLRVGDELSIVGIPAHDEPANWEVRQRMRVVQMIRRDQALLRESVVPLSSLSAADVGEMLALVALTRPGPFCERTIELGAFVGLRQNGRLLAMAGERLWIGDHREVSGVCTHPEAQGSGLARALLAHVINRMLRAGQVPFLHVDGDNARAIALYETLGFVRRKELALIHARKMG